MEMNYHLTHQAYLICQSGCTDRPVARAEDIQEVDGVGTRSTTTIWDGDKKLVSLYRQFDGYPTVHGQVLANFLKQFDVMNGIRHPDNREDNTRPRANGAGCLAAALITHLKSNIKNYDMSSDGDFSKRTIREGDYVGGIYVIPHEDAGGQAYHYDVIITSEGEGFDPVYSIEIQTDYGWNGTPDEFDGQEHEDVGA
jgi:hypothetical protein